MGLDYIRARTGKPWRKRWEGGLNRLKEANLFELPITESARLVMAEFLSGTNAKAGDRFIVQSDQEGLLLSDGLRSVGRIARPPAEVCSAIREAGGYAEGTLERVSIFGDAGELSIK